MEVMHQVVRLAVAAVQVPLAAYLLGVPLEEAMWSSLTLFTCTQLVVQHITTTCTLPAKNIIPTTFHKALALFALLSAGTGGFYLIAVLFGAPVLTNGSLTMMWSLFMTVMVVLPLALQGIDPLRPTGRSSRATMLGSAGALLGAWAGAFAIPLDWDRPWQPFPISSTYGALYGQVLGQAIALGYLLVSAVLRDKRPK